MEEGIKGSTSEQLSKQSASVVAKTEKIPTVVSNSTGGNGVSKGLVTKIALIVLGMLVTAGLGYLVYIYVLKPSATPEAIRVTNVTDRSATIVWRTGKATSGVVIYSETDDFKPSIFAKSGKAVAYDDRDVSVARLEQAEELSSNVDLQLDKIEDVKVTKQENYMMHHVTITGLEPEKTYYFMVGNGSTFVAPEDQFANEAFSVADGRSFATYKETDEIRVPSPTYGRIEGENDEVVDDAVVFMSVTEDETASPLSGLTNDTGSWYIDIANARTRQGDPITEFDEEKGNEIVYVDAGPYGRSELISNPMSADAPAVPFTVSKSAEEQSHRDVGLGVVSSVQARVIDGESYDFSEASPPVGVPAVQEVPPYGDGNRGGGEYIKPVLSYDSARSKVESRTERENIDVEDSSWESSLEDFQEAEEERMAAELKAQMEAEETRLRGEQGWQYYGEAWERNLADQAAAQREWEETVENAETVRWNAMGEFWEEKNAVDQTNKAVADSWVAKGVFYTGGEYQAYVDNLEEEERHRQDLSNASWTAYADAWALEVYSDIDNAAANRWIATGEFYENYEKQQRELAEIIQSSGDSMNERWAAVGDYYQDIYDQRDLDLEQGQVGYDARLLAMTSFYQGIQDGYDNAQATRWVAMGAHYRQQAVDEGEARLAVRESAQAFADASEFFDGSYSAYVSCTDVNGDEGCSDEEAVLMRASQAMADAEKEFLRLSLKDIPAAGQYSEDQDRDSTQVYPGAPIQLVPVPLSDGNETDGNLMNRVKAQEQETQDVSVVVSDDFFLRPVMEGVYDVTIPGTGVVEDVSLVPGEEYVFFVDTNENGEYDEGDDLVNLTETDVEVVIDDELSVSTIYLSNGLNFVSFNYLPEVTDSCQFIIELNKESTAVITQVGRFESGRFEITSYRDDLDEPVAGSCFPVVPGRGYVIRAYGPEVIDFPGYLLLEPAEVSLDVPGWHLVGVNGPVGTYTAESLIDAIDSVEGLDADNVTHWLSSASKYEGLQKEEDGSGIEQVYGFDFPLTSFDAYFVRIVEGSSTWTPTKKE